MSALSRIRNNIGFVAVVIAIALLGFILTDFFSSVGSSFSGPANAGSIAGETITAQEFAERYQQSSQNTNIPEGQRFYFIDQVWNQMINEIVFKNEYDKVGLEISGAEVYDMFTGSEPHPVVRQYFIAPDAPYDVNNIKSLLQNMLNDSTQSAQLRLFEDYLADSRAQERYLNMIASGFVSSKQAAKQKYIEQNRKVNISFLGVNYTQIPDSLIEVSDSELRDYMSDHEKKYQQEEEFFIKYVKFDIMPSQADSLKAYEKMLKAKKTFSEYQNDSLYTSNNSRTVFSPSADPVPVSQLPPLVKDSIKEASEKDVFGPYLDGKYYKLYKLVRKGSGDEVFSNIQHILITPQGNTQADTTEALALATSLRAQATADNFADLVNENSRDFASKKDGGVIGWYTKGIYGEDFDKAVDRASVGSTIGPIKSTRGFHIVRILDRTSETYAVAEIESEIYPGSETEARFYREANQFAAKAQSTANIDTAAAALGLNVIRSNPLTKTSFQILGLTASEGSRDLVRWAVDASIGDFSKVEKAGDLDTGESYVLAQLVERKTKGLRPLEEVRAAVSTAVINKKKAAMIKEKLAALSGDDLNALKEAYGAGAFVSTANDISFSSSTIPGIGADPLLIGKAVGMSEGELSSPIEGTNGVYILKVISVTEAEELDDEVLADRKDSEADLGENAIRSKISPALTKLADVEDNRYKIGY